jgi:hypothetical protein
MMNAKEASAQRVKLTNDWVDKELLALSQAIEEAAGQARSRIARTIRTLNGDGSNFAYDSDEEQMLSLTKAIRELGYTARYIRGASINHEYTLTVEW